MKRKRILIAAAALILLGLALYQLPPVKSRLEWRITNFVVGVQRKLNPPEEAIFVPSGETNPQEQEIALQVSATLEALAFDATNSALTASAALTDAAPTSTAPAASSDGTPTPTATTPPAPSATPFATEPPLLTPTPIPGAVQLTGTRHEYETWNNCGPATIGMQLSFWGWQGDQRVTAAWLKPNPRDKNVSPAELVAYVESQTEFQALYREGGDLELLKALIAAGFPTIIEKTLDLVGVDGWIGHYALVTGYDDTRARFTTQDSYIQPDFPAPYDKVQGAWRSFNYTFLVVYPPEREAELMALLGPLADRENSYQLAAARAQGEATALTGLDQYFAQFNLGSGLAGLGNYAEAAAAFDTAFALYSELAPEERPWRMVWYQHGPYVSYFETGRYQDVIDLADTTLSTMGEQTVEETFYWRGLAKAALGDVSGGITDISLAIELNSNYAAAKEALSQLQGD